jgi:hypothetical protein
MANWAACRNAAFSPSEQAHHDQFWLTAKSLNVSQLGQKSDPSTEHRLEEPGGGGGDVIIMSVPPSAMGYGQGRDPDRHGNDLERDAPRRAWSCATPASGAVHLLSEEVDGAVVNAGDGSHEHPTKAVFDPLTIGRYKGRRGGLTQGDLGRIRIKQDR